MARGAELAGIALRAEDSEQILEGVAEALAVVVAELVDDLEEGLERLGVAIRQIGVLEDVAEERRDAGILRHLGDAFGVEAEHLVAAEAGAHELGPAVAGEVAGEELALAAEFLGLGVHVVHELVDQRDGDLLDLGLSGQGLCRRGCRGRCRCGVWYRCRAWDPLSSELVQRRRSP